ncbi:MAG: hypothetical protein QOC95_2664 [Thermoleophilaceae bacterium]|nr:hypothetical protein [Thermoleophilaceae bacterium]
MRPIAPADRELLAAAFARLTPESRYRRFFSQVSELTPRQLDYLTDVDHHDHEALVVLAADSEDIAAVARYVRTSPPNIAEPAIVVGDEWQGRGMASSLLDLLADRAREEGIDTFVAPVLAENRDAIRLFEQLGEATASYDGREVELTIALGVEPGATRSLRRLLQNVAAGSVRPALAFWQRIATSGSPRGGADRRNAIIVGVPADEAVERVAAVVGAIAGGLGAEVHVVAAQRFMLGDLAELEDRMGKLRARFGGAGLEVESHVRRGDLAASLIHEAVDRAARLIVVDGRESHSATPLRGSTWDHVSHHAPCDVLIVR